MRNFRIECKLDRFFGNGQLLVGWEDTLEDARRTARAELRRNGSYSCAIIYEETPNIVDGLVHGVAVKTVDKVRI